MAITVTIKDTRSITLDELIQLVPHSKAAQQVKALRQDPDTPSTPAESLCMIQETNRLVIKAARRCAYDLKHAAAGQRDREEGELYENRARMWLTIFDPADEGKSYRDRLHMTITNLEDKVSKYRKWFKERVIQDPHPDEIF